jgi:uncharacterized membrane protein (UPF0127 family)
MKQFSVFTFLCAALFGFGFSGCDKSASPPPAPTAAAAPATPPMPPIPTNAQPKLQTMKIYLGAEEVTAELALTGLQMQTGMMFRTNMAENESMLFVFGVPHQASFWMMNTKVPLSAAYIDPDGVIQEIHNLQPNDTNSVTAATDRIQYVLETPQGWFQRHNINTGAVIRTERGSLNDTFFKQR